MNTDDPAARGDAEVADLVDKVMRGQVVLLAPPGTLASALVIPCFAVASASISIGIALAISRSLVAIYSGCLAAVALLAYPLVGQVLIITGRGTARRWLLGYPRILMVCVVASAAVTAFLGRRTPWLAAVISLAALAACDRLLRSRSYLEFSSFMSLKRRYRKDVGAASAQLLDRPGR